MKVANPISAGHGDRMAQNLNFLLNYCCETVGSSWLPTNNGGVGTSSNVSLLYSRSPGVKLLLVAAQINQDVAGTKGRIKVTLSGATWVLRPDGSAGANGLDGTVDLLAPSGGSVRVPLIIGLLDVSGVTPNTVQELQFKYTKVTAGIGMAYVHAAEVPLADIDPLTFPLTEFGTTEPTTREQIVDGSASVGRGYVRTIAMMDVARAQMKRHMQFATIQDTNLCWYTASLTQAVINWQQLGTNWDIKLSTRVRRLYDIGSSNQMTWAVMYRTTDNVTGGVARLSVTPVGGSPVVFDLTLAASTTWTIASMAISVKVNASPRTITGGIHASVSQLAEFSFRGLINTSPKTLYLATQAIIENES